MGDAPGFGGVGDLDGVEKWDVEGSHDRVIERADVFDDGAQVGDGSGAWEMMGGEILFEGLQARGVEGFAFDASEERGEELKVFEGVVGGVKDGCGVVCAGRR